MYRDAAYSAGKQAFHRGDDDTPPSDYALADYDFKRGWRRAHSRHAAEQRSKMAKTVMAEALQRAQAKK